VRTHDVPVSVFIRKVWRAASDEENS